MKYILVEPSAAEVIVTQPNLQTLEFEEGKHFVDLLKGKTKESAFLGNKVKISINSDGIMLVGAQANHRFLVVDVEQCHLDSEPDSDFLLIIQKTLRFAIRYWDKNQQSFTASENIVDNKAVLFPFAFSQEKSDYRVVIAREPDCPRLQKRGVTYSLLLYKYNDLKGPKSREKVQLETYQKAGELYIELLPSFVQYFNHIDSENRKSDKNISVEYVTLNQHSDFGDGFRFMPFEKQLEALTNKQRQVVMQDNLQVPIRVEGPAGTGKTLSLILRALRILKLKRKEENPFSIAFFAHSKATEYTIKMLFDSIWGNNNWSTGQQKISVYTLQEYCVQLIQLSDAQIIDGDALESKQYQLQIIQEIYATHQELLNTYKPHLSAEMRSFFEQEDVAKIVTLLQHEFSIQIKGYAEEIFDKYSTLPPLPNGLPTKNEDDKNFIYNLFSVYQHLLRRDSVFDTDDVVLEATARFRGPVWKRERASRGFDYIFVDEMHLFNLNEQQVFHYLTKDLAQESIPLCFALDYSQAIGDRGDVQHNYIETTLSKNVVISEKYSTVFRSSQDIAELCASITASGATLFRNFVNPYNTPQSGHTVREDAFCRKPTLYMYQSDPLMIDGINKHIDDMKKIFHADAREIAVIVFDQGNLYEKIKKAIKSSYTELVSRNSIGTATHSRENIILSPPENVNGLEFYGVILVGVDEGRVPLTTANDISERFLKYRALNQLYLTCSRAKYQVRILGNINRGISPCLNYSISHKTLEEVVID